MASGTPDDSVCKLRAHRTYWLVAIALTLACFFLFDHFRPDYLVDEPGHLGNIYHFIEGKSGWPEQMTMLPGYHFTVSALWQLHPPLKLLTLARLVTTCTALLALFAFGRTWTLLHGRPAGPAVLLLALLPIVQPFTGLAYTDVPGLAFTLLAVGVHLAGYRATGALVFGVAVCLRQTNVSPFPRPSPPQCRRLRRRAGSWRSCSRWPYWPFCPRSRSVSSPMISYI